MNYPIVMSTPELEKIFTGIYALPTSFIVDRTQQIVQKHVGMLNASTTEAETRYLAGLDTNVSVEHVEDETKAMIRNAAQATKIPGVDLDKLSPAAKAAALKQLNTDTCTCGCGLTLAACRINDPGCNISLPLAQKIVAEAALAPVASGFSRTITEPSGTTPAARHRPCTYTEPRARTAARP